MLAALEETPSLTDQFMLDALRQHVDRVKPGLIGLSVPFQETSTEPFVSRKRSKSDIPASPSLWEADASMQDCGACPIGASSICRFHYVG
jgi:hypothetical protein